MGLNGSNGSFADRIDELHRTRFGAYFPRVFACAHSLTGDEHAAKEVAIEAFTRTFAQRADLSDDEFAILLFDTTRDLCRVAQPLRRRDGGLSGRERELLALVFDARLSRESIRRLMHTSEQSLSSTLLSALQKLRRGMAPAAAGRPLRPA